MFYFDPVNDIDLDSYEYKLYDIPNPTESTTPIASGRNKANVFTISVTNSSDGVTKTYYGKVAVVNSAGTVGTYTSLVSSGATPLIGNQYINSLTAAKITAGTIGAHQITLGGTTSIIKSSTYDFTNESTTSGWYIRGDGHFSLGGPNGITYDNETIVIGEDVQVEANFAADSISVPSGGITKLNINSGIGGGVGGMTLGDPTYNYWYANGNFSVGGLVSGSPQYVKWDGSTLSVVGQITSTSGTIGGWKIGSSAITSANDLVTMNSDGNFSIGTSSTNKATITSDGDFTVIGNGGGSYGVGTATFFGPWYQVKKGSDPNANAPSAQMTYKDFTFFTNTTGGYKIFIGGGNDGNNAFIDVGATGVTDNNSISCSGWFRSTGVTGWYNQTYGGGIYMADTTWIRTYGSKNLYVDAKIRVDGGGNIQTDGLDQGGIYIQQGIGIDSNQVEATGALFLNALGAGGVRVNGLGTSGYGLTVNGNAAKSSGGTAWATFSDLNLKKDITEYEKGLSQILQLRPVYFKYNGKAGTVLDEDNVGLIAQEVQVVFPKAVEEFQYCAETKPTEDTAVEKYLSFSFNEVQYALINAIKELSSKVDELESRLV